MIPAPELQRLARQCGGDPEAALEQVLALLCEQLGMDAAVVGHLHDGLHTISVAVSATAGRQRHLEGPRPAELSWCSHVPGRSPLIVRDAADEPELEQLEVTAALDVRCYAGTLLHDADGREVGVLGVLRHTVHDRLDTRDVQVLEGLADVVGGLYDALLRGVAHVPAVVPAPRHPGDPGDPGDAAVALGRGEDVEGLTRPLLEALHELSGLASTYLTVVHAEAGVQEVRYARNLKVGFEVGEGLECAWEDTLCKRALEDGVSSTFDAQGLWPGSVAADIGIVTYASVPVKLTDGRLWGTLCAADDVAHASVAEHVPTLALFARLIAAEVERAAVVGRERARAVLARYEADTDELTGCASRRTVHPWLTRALDACRAGEVVVVAFVDVDDFKTVNDQHGHATGDGLLAGLGERLLSASRPGDLVARLGGDEFVVGARLPRAAVGSLEARLRTATTFVLDADGCALPVRCSLGMVTSDQAPEPAALLAASDAAMYRDKPLVQV